MTVCECNMLLKGIILRELSNEPCHYETHFFINFFLSVFWRQYVNAIFMLSLFRSKIFLKNAIQAQSEISRKSNRSLFPLSANQFFFYCGTRKLPNKTDPQMLFVHVYFWTKPDFTFFLEMINIIPHSNFLKDKPNF